VTNLGTNTPYALLIQLAPNWINQKGLWVRHKTHIDCSTVNYGCHFFLLTHKQPPTGNNLFMTFEEE